MNDSLTTVSVFLFSSGNRQRAFRSDEGFLGGIGHGVGEKHLIHSRLELAGTYALLSFQERGKR